MKIVVGCLVAGVGFGAATSLVNALSSPYAEPGAVLLPGLTGLLAALTVPVGAAVLGVRWAVHRFWAARRAVV